MVSPAMFCSVGVYQVEPKLSKLGISVLVDTHTPYPSAGEVQESLALTTTVFHFPPKLQYIRENTSDHQHQTA
eukprot:6474802-Amphidinium_carterae.2